MEDEKMRELAKRLGLSPLGDARQSLPVDPQLWRRAEQVHENERGLIFVRAINKEIDREEGKRLLREVTEKVKATYLALALVSEKK